MNFFCIIFLLVCSSALLIVSRRLAPVPLLVGACYMTLSQGVEIGPFSFTVIRILIAVGFIRVIIRGERLSGAAIGIDWLMVVWALWALSSSILRLGFTDVLVGRMGLVYNTCGIYFLVRVFSKSIEDLSILLRITAFLLFPIGLEMIFEKLINYNIFSVLGGVPSFPTVRDGIVRAQGPFRHPILAGTVGAVCLPLMIGIWRLYRRSSFLGIFACISIVICSTSSGPIMSALAGVGALMLWRYREKLRILRWAAIGGYAGIDLIMDSPAYYLIGRLPIIPSSTGWHRAELINAAIRHIDEWWLWGTDYTRHWMPTGVSWNPDHTDITNHYIQLGVFGGLPLMIIFILTLAKGFSYVGQAIRVKMNQESQEAFMIWGFGASLFANSATMISVSYFDQSFIFLYLTLAAIGSTWSSLKYAESYNSEANSDISAQETGAIHV